jgi:UDP-glucose 4-epimerase
MKYIVTGGAGFIGSHLVDSLLRDGHEVTVIDSLLSGNRKYIQSSVTFVNCDIRKYNDILPHFVGIDGVFHLAAIARTPWCIDDPILAYETNVMGTLHVLEAARTHGVKRIVLTSSNVVHAFMTPYRSSKQALEDLGDVYVKMYGMSVISLRNSNVYGSRQSELGPSPNVFSALRKSKREKGILLLTGDGEQTRDYTHVSDIVAAHRVAMRSDVTGVFDLCTGARHTLNKVASFFQCPIRYTEDRPGDVKHIIQDPTPARERLGWTASVTLEEGIKDFLNDTTFDQ